MWAPEQLGRGANHGAAPSLASPHLTMIPRDPARARRVTIIYRLKRNSGAGCESGDGGDDDRRSAFGGSSGGSSGRRIAFKKEGVPKCGGCFFGHLFFCSSVLFFLGCFENTGTSSLWGRKPLTACKSPDTVVVYLLSNASVRSIFRYRLALPLGARRCAEHVRGVCSDGAVVLSSLGILYVFFFASLAGHFPSPSVSSRRLAPHSSATLTSRTVGRVQSTVIRFVHRQKTNNATFCFFSIIKKRRTPQPAPGPRHGVCKVI